MLCCYILTDFALISRQSHKSYFEKSDLFFVCMLQPLSKEIHPQEAEIEAAQVCFYYYYFLIDIIVLLQKIDTMMRKFTDK